MDTQNTYNQPDNEEDGLNIDWMAVFNKCWNARLKIILWGCIGAAVGLVVGFSIPKTYSTKATLAPEVEQRMGSGVSSIASMMGVSVNNSVDALSYEVFPDIISSTPFIFKLLSTEVETKDGKVKTDLLDYMLNHTKSPWWSKVLALPGQAIGWCIGLVTPKDEEEAEGPKWKKGDHLPIEQLDMYNLPKPARIACKALSESIVVTVDKKTGKTDMELKMQDPKVVYTVMNAIIEDLKAYMSEYRASKATQDVKNLTEILVDRKADYYKAQQAYAIYSDSNKSVILQRAQAERERLRQEMDIAYQVYSQVATQLEAARLREQLAKPVVAIIQPPVVPSRKSGPSKAKNLVGFAFLFVLGCAAWEGLGKEYWDKLKAMMSGKDGKEEKAETAE